jgi:hypothetical protein
MAEITRDNQVPDVLYVLPDGACFVTPDGVGRYWYDDEDEAALDYDIERTEYIESVSE